jgi:hypothetical protein
VNVSEGWGDCYLHLLIADKVKHVMRRPLDYEYLLDFLKRKIDWAEVDNLHVEDLWRLWQISTREILPSAKMMHFKNTKFILRELRSRGITLRPDKPVVVHLPASVGMTKREVKLTLKAALRKSFLPLCVCDHILRRLTLVWEHPRQVGSVLDNGAGWAEKVVKGERLSCACDQFPDLPRRHGHIYCPSWQYVGEYQDLIRAPAKSHVARALDFDGVGRALVTAWLRYLPQWSIPFFDFAGVLRTTSRRVNSPGDSDTSTFGSVNVRQAKTFFSRLAVTGVDKCSQSLLLWCPELYETKYTAAFSVESDPTHFSREFESADKCLECMSDEYAGGIWSGIGSFNPGGVIPMHYILPKYKDIVAKCEDVMAKKGTCCRVRPILPYTQHPLRIPFKRGGKALSFLVKNLPRNQFCVNSAEVVKDRIVAYRDEALARYGTNFKWVVWVGDISNMYDELDPDAAVRAVRTVLANAAEWAGRRKIDRLHMTRAGAEVGWGPKLRADMLEITFDQLAAMVEYDCKHCYYQFDKGVNLRKFGVPMGGMMSPGVAQLMCALCTLLASSKRPAGLIGGVSQYMDDVLSVLAVSTSDEEQRASEWRTVIENCYDEPLVLNIEPDSQDVRFLELLIHTQGHEISCRLYNATVVATLEGKLSLQRLAKIDSGTSPSDRMSLVQGYVARAVQGCSGMNQLLGTLQGFSLEMALADWPQHLLWTALYKKLEQLEMLEDIEITEKTKELVTFLGEVVWYIRVTNNP